MIEITFLQSDGSRQTVYATAGFTLMETAVRNGVRGIDADCGGACACATCHVHISEAWRARLKPPQPLELSMLEFAAEGGPDSRLACQIAISEALNGLVVRTPERQG
ncbi:MAG: 2Fe-2S iron-sulfur cluster-binding protein [Pseudomonadota bacterium]